ncbi:MAG: hypothetical protein JWO45_1060 [Spartobacteria bacterium]|nr:hypothetical protein [Spartobacteria bacterium]
MSNDDVRMRKTTLGPFYHLGIKNRLVTDLARFVVG